MVNKSEQMQYTEEMQCWGSAASCSHRSPNDRTVTSIWQKKRVEEIWLQEQKDKACFKRSVWEVPVSAVSRKGSIKKTANLWRLFNQLIKMELWDRLPIAVLGDLSLQFPSISSFSSLEHPPSQPVLKPEGWQCCVFQLIPSAHHITNIMKKKNTKVNFIATLLNTGNTLQ